MQRGQVWTYAAALAGRPTLRLIVSTNGVNADDSNPRVLAVAILPDDPGGILATRVGEHGWASALTVAPHRKQQFTQHVGTVDMSTVDAILRVALEL